ncbi:unnamed protein product [Allacma fusca]|uniref:Uncharacterized protein n=1 Tax=Allacma fusca TaxID=39272 RepID=A0A8J2LL92_9HEXA|nr:unnamed protein product [Allacma fusca]
MKINCKTILPRSHYHVLTSLNKLFVSTQPMQHFCLYAKSSGDHKETFGFQPTEIILSICRYPQDFEFLP